MLFAFLMKDMKEQIATFPIGNYLPRDYMIFFIRS